MRTISLRSAQALESEYVSRHLPKWIDLIFGHKQKGAPALKANNLFHMLSYHDAVDVDEIEDPMEVSERASRKTSILAMNRIESIPAKWLQTYIMATSTTELTQCTSLSLGAACCGRGPHQQLRNDSHPAFDPPRRR
tara:strand:- start:74 stop:484 length:411 start_codon:yes stop_codon:yes gene_type:complete